MIYAAIAAGGKGMRMGADVPKQFLNVGGKPIIIRTAEQFLKNERIDCVYIGVNAEWSDRLREMCVSCGIGGERLRIVCGGSDRNGTIFNIVEEIERRRSIDEGDIILTHDGARPFLSQRLIDDCIDSLKSADASTAAIPSTDTVLISADGRTISEVPLRSTVFRMQTPQSFRIKKLIESYAALSDEQKLMLTDTASIFTMAGLPVGLVEGELTNIKITSPPDLDEAEIIAKKFD